MAQSPKEIENLAASMREEGSTIVRNLEEPYKKKKDNQRIKSRHDSLEKTNKEYINKNKESKKEKQNKQYHDLNDTNLFIKNSQK